jgi:hypothetical protein
VGPIVTAELSERGRGSTPVLVPTTGDAAVDVVVAPVMTIGEVAVSFEIVADAGEVGEGGSHAAGGAVGAPAPGGALNCWRVSTVVGDPPPKR